MHQYCRDELALDNYGAIVDFTNDNTTDSFKCKEKVIGQMAYQKSKTQDPGHLQVGP